MNKIEIYSKKLKKVVYDYTNIDKIDDDMLTLAKVESVLDERPAYMPDNVLKECLTTFDKYFILLVNWKEPWKI